jgi:hypothetical protein
MSIAAPERANGHATPARHGPTPVNEAAPRFHPRPATDFASAGLTSAQVEGIVLRFMQTTGKASGRRIADELGLPFGPFPDFLRGLKNQQVLTHANSAGAGDFEYMLTDFGRMRAQAYFEECAYVGTAPVPFSDYLEAVAAQGLGGEHPQEADLRSAFSDLVVSDAMFAALGPAINSGRGLFLYGAAGNGKTAIAERITHCFGCTVFIPRSIQVEGQIVKLFDPAVHEPVASRRGGLLRRDDQDDRWIEIKRPTIIAGGELTMDSLEIRYDPATKLCEAPLQMKSNNGILLIDDFGRQRMSPIELLNRWIVPLEKRYDFLGLPNGKKIRVPFDQLIIFSTNLAPKDLVDEAFLRRIPYKIEAPDPSEDTFRRLFELFGARLGFAPIDPGAIDHLIEAHFRRAGRPFRACQPRDLLLQVRNQCLYQGRPLEVTARSLDLAVEGYFAMF